MGTQEFNLQWLLLLLPLVFVAFWCAICGLISLGGWRKLAQDFRAPDVDVGPLRGFQSLIIGSAKYNGALSIGVWPSGLYLRVLPIFRVGHPPLLIPWHAIGPIQEKKVWWTKIWLCEVTTLTSGPLQLTISSLSLAEFIAAQLASHGTRRVELEEITR